MTHNRSRSLHISELLRSSREASIQELCLPHSLGPKALIQLEGGASRERRLRRGERLFRQGHGLHALYVVTRGLLKTVIVDREGREQITGFHFPYELVGLDALHIREHVCMAVAVKASGVRVLPLHRLEDAMQRVPALREAIGRLIGKVLVEHEQLLMVVNQRSAVERVAILLFSLACRLGRDDQASTTISLGMSRAEIANYLGLAPETVSRAIRKLQHAGILEGRGKHMRIVDPARLAEWAVSGCQETP